MRRLGLVAAMLATVVLAFSASGAAAPTQTRTHAYSCTIFLGNKFGVIFSGTNRRLLRRGCRIFANGAGKPIEWGIHERPGWTWVAQYAQPKLAMIAQSIAPPRFRHQFHRRRLQWPRRYFGPSSSSHRLLIGSGRFDVVFDRVWLHASPSKYLGPS